MFIIARFAKVLASVYSISFILFLSTLPVLQKQVVGPFCQLRGKRN